MDVLLEKVKRQFYFGKLNDIAIYLGVPHKHLHHVRQVLNLSYNAAMIMKQKKCEELYA